MPNQKNSDPTSSKQKFGRGSATLMYIVQCALYTIFLAYLIVQCTLYTIFLAHLIEFVLGVGILSGLQPASPNVGRLVKVTGDPASSTRVAGLPEAEGIKKSRVMNRPALIS